MLEKIKNKNILKKIFRQLKEVSYLRILKYNKQLKKRLNISKSQYEGYYKIELELKIYPMSFGNCRFINIKDKDKLFYHFYSGKKEIKHNYITNKSKIRKIKIIIDKKVNSFKGLFKNCKSIKEIKIIKFNRKNILDMSEMFSGCSFLTKLNSEKIITNNVQDMSNMFDGCTSLVSLNLSNFNTSNVVDMDYMFYRCNKLKKLEISNFDTSKVTYMRKMFYECFLLEELDLSNFDTSNITDMECLFFGCESLKTIKGINDLNTNKVIKMNDMFYGCSSLLNVDTCKFKDIKQIKNF